MASDDPPVIGDGKVLDASASAVFRCGCSASTIFLLLFGMPSRPCPGCGSAYLLSQAQLEPAGAKTQVLKLETMPQEGTKIVHPDEARDRPGPRLVS